MENESLNEQNKQALLPKLFRVWKTLNKMAEYRGYSKEKSSKDNLTFEQWQKMNNKQ